MRGKQTQMEMQAQILNSFSLTLTFAFGFALGLVTRVFPCICICVRKQTEKFSKFCLHHSNLSISLENGIKKSVSQISQESKLKTKD